MSLQNTRVSLPLRFVRKHIGDVLDGQIQTMWSAKSLPVGRASKRSEQFRVVSSFLGWPEDRTCTLKAGANQVGIR